MHRSGRVNSLHSFLRITADRTAARTDVPTKFSQIPVSPNGRMTPMNTTGKISAVEIEIMEAGIGFSTDNM